MKASVKAIRDWELNAGESFTDYFLDAYSYVSSRTLTNRWIDFLVSKGLSYVAQEIEEDTCQIGDRLFECTDQQLKFEPHNTAAEQVEGYGSWDENEYLKDVALWAEFINEHSDILTAYQVFIGEDE